MSAGDVLLILVGVLQLANGFMLGRFFERSRNIGRCELPEFHELDELAHAGDGQP